jgi:hypothetical protein
LTLQTFFKLPTQTDVFLSILFFFFIRLSFLEKEYLELTKKRLEEGRREGETD